MVADRLSCPRCFGMLSCSGLRTIRNLRIYSLAPCHVVVPRGHYLRARFQGAYKKSEVQLAESGGAVATQATYRSWASEHDASFFKPKHPQVLHAATARLFPTTGHNARTKLRLRNETAR